MKSKRSRRFLNLDILGIAQDTLRSMMSAITWGKETQLEEIDSDSLTDWFRTQRQFRSEARYGVLYAKTDVLADLPRIYQGILDADLECIIARQVVSEGIAEEVMTLLEDQSLVIFDFSLSKSENKGTGDSEA
jgi:hypothetical protein